jgi:hypothetical protein
MALIRCDWFDVEVFGQMTLPTFAGLRTLRRRDAASKACGGSAVLTSTHSLALCSPLLAVASDVQ